MKALFSFALVCALFSMSSFTVVKPPAHKAVVKPATVTWPITGTRLSYTYTITGSGITPSYIQFSNGTSNYGPFTFTLQSNGAWLATIPSTSPVFTTIKAVQLGVYGDGSGYSISWFPDLGF